jgi:hypothetical protein
MRAERYQPAGIWESVLKRNFPAGSAVVGSIAMPSRRNHLDIVGDVPAPREGGIEDVLGDFGVDNLAGNREGRPYFGACVKRVRQKSSLRHEPRFRKHTNHRMCKEIVANVRTLPRCDCDRRPDAHKRVKARRNATARMVLSFANSCHTRSVQQAIGLPIDPRNTACQESGSIRTGNRKTQDVFSATDRGYSAAHDLCDASNIRGHLL